MSAKRVIPTARQELVLSQLTEAQATVDRLKLDLEGATDKRDHLAQIARERECCTWPMIGESIGRPYQRAFKIVSDR
jgi:hypothetical protein